MDDPTAAADPLASVLAHQHTRQQARDHAQQQAVAVVLANAPTRHAIAAYQCVTTTCLDAIGIVDQDRLDTAAILSDVLASLATCCDVLRADADPAAAAVWEALTVEDHTRLHGLLASSPSGGMARAVYDLAVHVVGSAMVGLTETQLITAPLDVGTLRDLLLAIQITIEVVGGARDIPPVVVSPAAPRPLPITEADLRGARQQTRTMAAYLMAQSGYRARIGAFRDHVFGPDNGEGSTLRMAVGRANKFLKRFGVRIELERGWVHLVF